MIELTVTDSPDLISIGTYQLKYHHIKIGRNLKNTIIIDDKELYGNQVTLRLTKKGLHLTSHYSFLHNGKKTKGSITLQKNDLIQLGGTEIKIISFDLSSVDSSDAYYKKLEEYKNNPTAINLIQSMEEEYIIQLERENNALEE